MLYDSHLQLTDMLYMDKKISLLIQAFIVILLQNLHLIFSILHK